VTGRDYLKNEFKFGLVYTYPIDAVEVLDNGKLLLVGSDDILSFFSFIDLETGAQVGKTIRGKKRNNKHELLI